MITSTLACSFATGDAERATFVAQGAKEAAGAKGGAGAKAGEKASAKTGSEEGVWSKETDYL